MTDTVASSSESREIRIGRILSDLHERKTRGECIRADEVLAVNPDLADELRPYLVVLDELCSARANLDGLIAQGTLSRSSDPKYPACLGSYKIIDFIGRGGMGVVLKAHDESLNRPIALKVLRPELANDTAALHRFHREAKAAAALRHPNIVTVHAVGEERGVHYIAMEYVGGPTLAEVIRQEGALPTETIRCFFDQLLKGLAAAHAADLIHRDIKSANLLLDKSPRPSLHNSLRAWSGASPDPDRPCKGGRELNPVVPPSPVLKIADFGLARALTAETRLTIPQSAFGTPEYMSPEQARGDEDVDCRTDLYSAGIVLYEMLTGRTPFRADTPAATIHRILYEEPAEPRKLAKFADPALSSLALRLMAKQPQDRFASAGEALAAMEAARRISSPERRRRRGRAISVLLTGALALAVGIWLVGGTPITAIRVIAGSNLIEARRGLSTQWEVFHEFSPEVPVRAAALVDTDGHGHRIVVAGTTDAREGKSLFAFSTRNEELWSLDLSDKRRWPDCGSTSAWGCNGIVAGDVDGLPGDEVIALAHHPNDYPTRISIIDPGTRHVRATFWHMGHLGNMLLQPDFFGRGRPAIVVGGMNNKLDGFYEPRPDDSPPLTPWDIVDVLMVLDPRQMLAQGDALGPPATKRVDLPEANMHAYAFLNLAHNEKMAVRTGEEAMPAPLEESGGIEEFGLSADCVGAGGPCFKVLTLPKAPELSALVIVDRDLAIRCVRVTDTPQDQARAVENYWRLRWKVIIRNGEYVDQPSDNSDRTSNK